MKKLFSILILLFAVAAEAKLPNIVALVNDKPITLYDFQARKQLFSALNNIQDQNNPAVDRHVNMLVLNGLIDESILAAHFAKLGRTISAGEINDAIISIEERNKMSQGQLAAFLKTKGVNINSFMAQIKGELVKMQIFSSISRDTNVTPREIDAVILSNDSVDAKVLVKVFTSKDKNDKTLHKMYSLHSIIKNCGDIKPSMYNTFANVIELDKNLSSIDRQLHAVIKDLEIGKTSSVFETEDGFKLLVLCDRQINNTTEEDNKYVNNLLTNKKTSQKTIKFLENLRKKAYIKIFIQD